MTALESRDPRESLVAEVRSQNVREQILAVLPQDVPFASFERAAIRALLTNADLTSADRRSLMRALIDCAYMGLVPDGRHAALVIYGNQAQALPMVAGIVSAASAYGWHMRANVAYSNDEFEWSDEPLSLIHRPARPGTARGELAYAYAIAIHRDGRRQQIVFDKTAVEKRKAKARTKNVWNEWAEEMWKKTAAHRLFKELPLDETDKRVARLSAEDIPPAEKVAVLYGPHASLEQGSPSVPPSATEGVAPTDAPPQGSAGLAASADPTSDDEPGPDTSDAEQAEALAAALYVPPSGKYGARSAGGAKTLGQIHESNPGWFQWAAKTLDLDSEYGRAVAAFARVYAAEQWQAGLAEMQASQQELGS